MFIFGCLTYRNIRQIKGLLRQYADRQLVKMTLIQLILVLISMIPFGINNSYNLITNGMIKQLDQSLKEAFALRIFTLTSYLYYIVSLVIYEIKN